MLQVTATQSIFKVSVQTSKLKCAVPPLKAETHTPDTRISSAPAGVQKHLSRLHVLAASHAEEEAKLGTAHCSMLPCSVVPCQPGKAVDGGLKQSVVKQSQERSLLFSGLLSADGASVPTKAASSTFDYVVV